MIHTNGDTSVPSDSSPTAWRFEAVVGCVAVLGFVGVYAAEFFPHSWPPAPLRWLLEVLGTELTVIVNVALFAGFIMLLPYRRETYGVWRTKGLFVAFSLALMSEMLGWPLLLFLLSPQVSIGLVNPYYQMLGHWPATIGMFLVFVGGALVVLGWHRVHQAKGIVSTGLYRYMRHPQYTGILLFSFGWIIDYPATLPLLLFPLLVMAYWKLARLEKSLMRRLYGAAYEEYVDRTPMFIPSVRALFL